MNSSPENLQIKNLRGELIRIVLDEISSIDLLIIPTMTVDVDCVRVNLVSGKFIEVHDTSDEFTKVCNSLSTALKINPSINQTWTSVPDNSQPFTIYRR
jgi:hypothetical protein